MNAARKVFGIYNRFPDADLACFSGTDGAVFSPFAAMDAIRLALEAGGRTVFAWLTIESWPAFFSAPALAPGDGVLFAFTYTTIPHQDDDDADDLDAVDLDDDDPAPLTFDDDDDDDAPTLVECACVAWLNKERECIVHLGEHPSVRCARGDDVSDLEGDEDRPTSHDDDDADDVDEDEARRLGGLRS